MRLSYNTLAVLHGVTAGVNYGFDIMEQTGLKSGQVYRALSRLEELGLVRSRWEAPDRALAEKRPRRRYYQATQRGKETLLETARRYQALADFEDPGGRLKQP